MTAVLTQALAFHAAGCCPIPAMNDGTKRPHGTWKRYQTRRPEPEELTAWFTPPLDLPGVGLVCGKVSGGLELLEFEGRAIHLFPAATELMKAAGLGETWARICAGYTEATPSGGLHLLLRVAGKAVPGNTKLARRPATEEELAVAPDEKIKVLIETRGEGGFGIVAPSNGATHPSGKPWSLIAGGPSAIATVTAEEHEAIHRVMRTFDEMPTTAPPASAAATSTFTAPASRPHSDADGRVSPVDDYNAKTTWPGILAPLGWTQVYTRGGVTYWRRPGKTIGVSATTREGNGDGLWVFSTSTQFEAERSYTRFGVYALLHHAGDFSAAAKALRAQGYGSPAAGTAPWVAVPEWSTPSTRADPRGVLDVDLPEPEPSPYVETDWKVAWEQAPEDVEWLCEPLFEKGRSYSLYSPPKAGKSLLVLEVAAALASGRAVLGNNPQEPVSVLYVDMENSLSDIVERLKDMSYGPHELDNLHYYSFPALPALDSRTGGEHLLTLALSHGADIVFLDTVSRLVEGKENESETYLDLYRLSLVPLKAAGITVVRLDHSGKDLERGQRGSSAKSGDVDAVWRMVKRVETRDSVIIDLVRTDSRNAHGAEAVTVTRRFFPLRHETAEGGGPRPEVVALAQEMERLGIPKNLGRGKVRALLAGTGLAARNDALSAAIKYRRTGLEALKTVPGQVGYPQGAEAEIEAYEPSPIPGTRNGEIAGRTCPGQAGTGGDDDAPAPGGVSGDRSPPLKGGPARDTAPRPVRSSPSLPLCRECGEPMSYDPGNGVHVMCGPGLGSPGGDDEEGE